MINKKYLARKIASRTLLTRKEADLIVDELFALIVEELKKGEEVNITNFGKFFLYTHNPRPVRNPRTLEDMVLKSYKSVKFKQSENLKKIFKSKLKN